MKKFIAIVASVLLIAGTTQAQDSTRHHHTGDFKGRKEHGPFMKELNLTQEQKAEFKSMHEASKSKMESIRNNSSLTEEQKKSQLAEIRKEQHEKMQRFLTPEQQTKFAARRKNHAGKEGNARRENQKAHSAFDHRGGQFEKMKEQLNLSEAQVNQLKEGRKELASRMQSIRNDKNLTEEQKKEQFRTLAEARRKNLESVLTPEQKAKLAEFRKNKENRTK